MTAQPTPVPTLAGWPAYSEAVAKRDGLADRLQQTHRELQALDRSAEAAASAADDKAQAAAMLKGGKDPGRVLTERHRADQLAASTQVRVLTEAVAQQDGVVLGMLRDDRDRALMAARAEADQAADTYVALIASVAQARSEFHTAAGTVAWLSDKGRRYKPGGSPGLTIRGVETANGDPLPVEAFLAALTAETSAGPRMVPGPWRGTLVTADEAAVRLVRRTRVELNQHGQPLSTTHYAIPADQVPADNAAAERARTLNDQARYDQGRNEQIAAQVRAQAPKGSPAPPPEDPLADLRDVRR